ncbi:hypothetical protein HDG41_003857 [Paraburkholderia sp. JPY162]|uniref:AprE-like beta-barrel domain-containing protein n=2 Tax=Paraburkholderia youngii TaxID=2782701 RepID=A0A7W8P1Y5_9BURK|nr:hypothetical protein [Paraburkholderia youngii]
MSVFTEGGTIGPGAKLMDVVPTGEPLEAEGHLEVNLVDKVRTGMPVDMMFTAFNQNTTPRASGTLTFVSADRLVDEHTGAPYYRVRAKVTEQGMKQLRKLDIKPGMPVEIFINAGQRSMLSYPLAAFQVRAAWTPSRFGPFKLFLRPLDLMHGEYVFACIPLIALGTYAIYCVWEATRDKYHRRTLLLLCGGLSMAILSIVISGDFHANGRYFLTFAPAIIGILRADGASTKCQPVLGIAMTVGAAFMVFNTVLIEMGLPPN